MIVLGEKISDAARERARASAAKLATIYQTTRKSDVENQIKCDGDVAILSDPYALVQCASPIERLYAVRKVREQIAPSYAFYARKEMDRRNGRVFHQLILEKPSGDASYREYFNDAALIEKEGDITDSLFMSPEVYLAWWVAPLLVVGALLSYFGTDAALTAFLCPFVWIFAFMEEPHWSIHNAKHVAWANKLHAEAEPALALLD